MNLSKGNDEASANKVSGFALWAVGIS